MGCDDVIQCGAWSMRVQCSLLRLGNQKALENPSSSTFLNLSSRGRTQSRSRTKKKQTLESGHQPITSLNQSQELVVVKKNKVPPRESNPPLEIEGAP
jgi:hypothetical protein